MTRTCAVPSCCSSEKGGPIDHSFHALPKNEDFAQEWILAIQNRNIHFGVTKGVFVCSRHFSSDDFIETSHRKLLKRGKILCFLPYFVMLSSAY